MTSIRSLNFCRTATIKNTNQGQSLKSTLIRAFLAYRLQKRYNYRQKLLIICFIKFYFLFCEKSGTPAANTERYRIERRANGDLLNAETIDMVSGKRRRHHYRPLTLIAMKTLLTVRCCTVRKTGTYTLLTVALCSLLSCAKSGDRRDSGAGHQHFPFEQCRCRR